MTSITIPAVETDRLILRAHREDDLDAMAAFFAGDRCAFVGGRMNRSDCWRGMMRGLGHWAMRGYGLWHIQEKATGRVAGWAGILHHVEWPEPELAYTLFEGFEGKGIALEAATAARDYAARHFGITAPISLIDPANTRSLALAERMGAEYEGDTEVMGHACQVWRHPKQDSLPAEVTFERAPVLTTDRLVLRHHEHADFAPMAEHFATDWAQYMGGPIDADELWRWVCAETTSWNWLGFGSWAVTLKDSGELIGQVGINKPPRFPETEIGWCIFPDHQGKGYASEAAKAALDWGFNTRGLTTLVSYIDAPNAPSIALAERLGAVLDASAKAPSPEDLVYRHQPQAGTA